MHLLDLHRLEKQYLFGVKNKLFQKKEIIDELKIDINFKGKILLEHHISHAASAFYPSPFEEALILTLDAVGEYTTSSIALEKEIKYILKKLIIHIL